LKIKYGVPNDREEGEWTAEKLGNVRVIETLGREHGKEACNEHRD
jgi:hypothetical protein